MGLKHIEHYFLKKIRHNTIPFYVATSPRNVSEIHWQKSSLFILTWTLTVLVSHVEHMHTRKKKTNQYFFVCFLASLASWMCYMSASEEIKYFQGCILKGKKKKNKKKPQQNRPLKLGDLTKWGKKVFPAEFFQENFPKFFPRIFSSRKVMH